MYENIRNMVWNLFDSTVDISELKRTLLKLMLISQEINCSPPFLLANYSISEIRLQFKYTEVRDVV